MQPPPQPLRPESPPQDLDDEAEAGKLSALKEKVASWGTHWATVGGRVTLRHAAVKAAQAGHVGALDYLCKEWGVPVNSIPADENLESFAMPLVAAVLADKEEVALHLLSLVRTGMTWTWEGILMEATPCCITLRLRAKRG